MILICYVLVSNRLKYYLGKSFSSKSCDLLGNRLLCTRMYMEKNKLGT